MADDKVLICRDCIGTAQEHLQKAMHHISLAPNQPEKQDWKEHVRNAIAILEVALVQ